VSEAAAPAGYEAFAVPGARVVARSAHADAVRRALTNAGTLFAYAAGRPRARSLEGRGPAWATTLPDGTPVVVRHARHGGLLAAITGDLFLAPTRAPRELRTARRLADAGVPTPEIVAYAVYPAFGPFARADVATRALDGRDFPEAWRAAADDAAREALVRGLARLLESLGRARAVHPDLNLKNVFLASEGAALTAYALDVDRVRFPAVADERQAAGLNLLRVMASARKWRVKRGLAIDERDLARRLMDLLGLPRPAFGR